jgi:hypothetical protein
VRAAAIVLSVVLAACDFLYGVSRRAALTGLPQVDCVREAIETTPGIDRVDHQASAGGTPITLSGVQSAHQSHAFLFRGDGVQGAVQIVVDYKGEVEFKDTLLQLNRKPPQELIDRTRRAMREIEARLEQRCAVAGLVRDVRETCLGVACPEP